uniref:Uncharacterized protein n=1 Tax=Aegilops tauschii subsp. strangulata TaxID=200361 RepID=A0A453QBQ4_AEGTS
MHSDYSQHLFGSGSRYLALLAWMGLLTLSGIGQLWTYQFYFAHVLELSCFCVQELYCYYGIYYVFCRLHAYMSSYCFDRSLRVIQIIHCIRCIISDFLLPLANKDVFGSYKLDQTYGNMWFQKNHAYSLFLFC